MFRGFEGKFGAFFREDCGGGLNSPGLVGSLYFPTGGNMIFWDWWDSQPFGLVGAISDWLV